MLALIDGDIVAYRCAASANNDPEDVAILRVENLMREILNAVCGETHRVFLSGEDNFRYKVWPEYKANRKDVERPQWLQSCREYLVKEWNAEFSHGCEADDMLGVCQGEDTIICSIDKDLLQIPGMHFNFVKNEIFAIAEPEGVRHFYSQSLIGDKADNIIGIRGIGPVKADRLLGDIWTEAEMYEVCRKLYDDDDRFQTNLKLLWIWRSPGDIFDPVKRGLVDQMDPGPDQSIHHCGTPEREQEMASEV